MDNQPLNAPAAADAAELLRHVERLQAAVTEQQRTLMRAPDEAARAAALRGTGLLVRQLAEMQEAAQRLDKEWRAQATRQGRLRALQEVGAAVNSSLDLPVVLQQVMDAIIRLTRAERAMLLLSDGGELEVKVARNISQETLGNEASGEISRSIVRRVAETGEPIVTLNAQEDERFSSQHSIVSYKLRSILCAPLKIKGQTIGVIYADNRIASGIFGDADRDLLALFADQAAVAIDNARLFHEVAEMKELMDNVFASIASGVITIDETDRVALYNHAAERILGVPAESVLFQTYRAVLAALGLPIDHLVQAVKREGRTHSAEMDLSAQPRSSATTVNLTVSPLRTVENERLGGVALLLDDVSEKKRVESLRRYLPPALVDRVRDLDAAQRPQRRTITVLFADIRDFSRYGEFVDPEALIQLANGFFTEAVTAINEHHGLIDKFMGDAVMALFNTPLNPMENHVEQAVRAALRIQERLAAYQRTLPPDRVLHFGIGLHTGETVVGNVGSAQRKDYSAVGDVVNLCKRLQELAGRDQTIISRDVYDQVRHLARVEPLPPVQVKGRRTLEEVYRLVSLV
ncbi:adenylate/guanylate cyclase domain-containing protein [Promineifilum sp.]|uniref:adenylate/guanylate cyclase domain-containing protein n=1 Tax=Promineifilum sp. TaxID=2664178 RepID=UPI0035AFBBFB